MDASLRPLLRIRALAALVHPEHRWHDEEAAEEAAEVANRWHDEEMAKGCFYLRRIRDALRILFPEIRDEPKKRGSRKSLFLSPIFFGRLSRSIL